MLENNNEKILIYYKKQSKLYFDMNLTKKNYN